jgi:hypothetical protein
VQLTVVFEVTNVILDFVQIIDPLLVLDNFSGVARRGGVDSIYSF